METQTYNGRQQAAEQHPQGEICTSHYVGAHSPRFICALIHCWYTCQLDFVLAYSPADVETVIYMEIPQGWECEGDQNTHVLKLLKNLYGQKRAEKVWIGHLMEGLVSLGFTQSKVDVCIMLIFTNGTLNLGPDNDEIDNIVKTVSSKLTIQDKGKLNECLGLGITRSGNTLSLQRPQLID